MVSALADPRKAQRPPEPVRPGIRISPARAAAFEVLGLVGQGRGHSDELLHGRHLRGLSTADKGLATALVLGVLRWQIALDARIRPLLQRPDGKLPAVVEVALRMGAYQLIHMDRIPAHAALSESVELVRADAPFAVGMVNAVLRKLSQQKAPGKKLHESPAAFAERLGHPTWLAERWTARYGRDAALAICEADQQEPQPGVLFAPEADDVEMPVMDDGSRLVAEIAAAAMPAANLVWDCCAAPGGKTLVLAERLKQAKVLATDASPRRLKALDERMSAAGLAERVKILEADAEALPQEHGVFDLILCDVPCSGTGTMARNPEIRHRMTISEIAKQAKRQREILAASMARLAPGGRLVYATCSLEPEENERVVAAALAGSGMQKVPVATLLQELLRSGRLAEGTALEPLVEGEFLRTLPSAGFDGFFAAVLERA